jgi:hypothetical protein
MANFTVRVELHEKSSNQKPDYETLHKRMADEGFLRTIKLKDGDPSYQLPTAEYSYIDNTITKEQVLQKAKNAAVKVDENYMVLVTQSDYARAWYNLPKK